MALVFSNISGNPRVAHMTPGMQIKQADMTVKNADYAAGAGFDVGGSASKLGMRKIYAVLAATVKNGAGNTLPLLWFTWDFQTDKLRAANATSEASAATAITDDSVIRLVVLGV